MISKLRLFRPTWFELVTTHIAQEQLLVYNPSGISNNVQITHAKFCKPNTNTKNKKRVTQSNMLQANFIKVPFKHYYQYHQQYSLTELNITKKLKASHQTKHIKTSKTPFYYRPHITNQALSPLILLAN